MLADQDTFVCDQRFSTFFLKVKTCPAVCILHFHCSRWTLASYTQEKGCETADNFCIWIGTDITNLSCIFCDLAVCDHLVQFHTCYNTGYITGFINRCKVIVHIGKSAACCLISCCMAELYIREFCCCLKDVGFMAKAVGKDDVASLVCKVYGCIITCLIFRDIPFDDDLIIRKSKCFLHTFCTGIMSGCITLILITDKDKANLQILSINTVSNLLCCLTC